MISGNIVYNYNFFNAIYWLFICITNIMHFITQAKYALLLGYIGIAITYNYAFGAL